MSKKKHKTKSNSTTLSPQKNICAHANSAKKKQATNCLNIGQVPFIELLLIIIVIFCFSFSNSTAQKSEAQFEAQIYDFLRQQKKEQIFLFGIVYSYKMNKIMTKPNSRLPQVRLNCR